MSRATRSISHIWVRFALITILAGCSGAEESSDRASQPNGSSISQQMVPEIDADQLMTDLAYFADDALEGRAAGSVGNQAAQEYIRVAFEAAELSFFWDGFEQNFSLGESDTGEERTGTNLIAFVRGTDHPDQFIVVTAHFDHLGVRDSAIYNGTDDNASGTAALLAFARHFSENPPAHSMVFAAVDAEELGLRGARAFLEDAPIPTENLILNVNMDMISRSDSTLFAVGTHHYPWIKPIIEKVVPTTPVVLAFGHDIPGTGSDDWTSASDHGPFHAAGIPFVYFGVEDHPDYHQPTDDFDKVDPDFYLASVQTILAAIDALDRTADSDRRQEL